MPTCPKCGKANPKRAKFCYDCGSPMHPPIITPPTPVRPPAPVPPIPKPAPTVRVIAPLGTGPAAPTPPRTTVSMRIPPMGTCSYHRELPAVYICSRCNRSICRSCGRHYLNMVFCPQCYGLAVPQPRYW